MLLVGKFLPLKVELTVHISCPTEYFFSLRLYFIPQQAEFHHLCIVQDKSFQPALMQQVTCCIYIQHTQDFNFMCNINQGMTYSHVLSLDSYHHHHTIIKPTTSHHHHSQCHCHPPLPTTSHRSHAHLMANNEPCGCKSAMSHMDLDVDSH